MEKQLSRQAATRETMLLGGVLFIALFVTAIIAGYAIFAIFGSLPVLSSSRPTSPLPPFLPASPWPPCLPDSSPGGGHCLPLSPMSPWPGSFFSCMRDLLLCVTSLEARLTNEHPSCRPE